MQKKIFWSIFLNIYSTHSIYIVNGCHFIIFVYEFFFKYLEQRRKEGRTSTCSDDFDKILEIKKNVSVVILYMHSRI